MTFSNARLFCAMFLAAGIGLQVAPASAQGPGAAAPDFSKVEIKTEKIAGNFYTLRGFGPDFYPSPNGRPSGTIGVLPGPEGVFMVDAQFAPLTDKVVAAIKQIQPDGRIRFLVNTHVHADHTSGDENFGKLGVTLIARENLRRRLAMPAREGAPMPAAVGLPMMTVEGPMTFRMNGEEVRIIPIQRAHTDGDVIVQFVNADVIMTSDLFRADNAYPNMDLANGGSLAGMLEGLNIVADLASPRTTIVPGHGPNVTWQAVAAQRNMIVTVRDRVAALIKDKKTQEQVLAAGVTADFDKTGLQNPTRFVTQLFQELSK